MSSGISATRGSQLDWIPNLAIHFGFVITCSAWHSAQYQLLLNMTPFLCLERNSKLASRSSHAIQVSPFKIMRKTSAFYRIYYRLFVFGLLSVEPNRGHPEMLEFRACSCIEKLVNRQGRNHSYPVEQKTFPEKHRQQYPVYHIDTNNGLVC
jgi:hypothetical protein